MSTAFHFGPRLPALAPTTRTSRGKDASRVSWSRWRSRSWWTGGYAILCCVRWLLPHQASARGFTPRSRARTAPFSSSAAT